jgi:hypothetical protein
LIRNEGFATWRNQGEINSRQRVRWKRYAKPQRNLNWDYVKVLADTLPKLRNEYAHGSTNLQATTLWFIQIVCEIINQLFEPPTKGIGRA